MGVCVYGEHVVGLVVCMCVYGCVWLLTVCVWVRMCDCVRGCVFMCSCVCVCVCVCVCRFGCVGLGV